MTQRIITEADIIAARQSVAEAEAKGEQMTFEDGLLGSAGLTPEMIREWLDAVPNVRWCACEPQSPPRIVCGDCGLPPLWVDETDDTPDEARARWHQLLSQATEQRGQIILDDIIRSVVIDIVTNKMARDDEYALVIGRRIQALDEAVPDGSQPS